MPISLLTRLQQRAELTQRVRSFFHARGVLEIDTPVLQGGANLDYGVVPFRLAVGKTARFLPTSPEHALKRLIAAGIGDCWTLAPAFRSGENGQRHAPEFRMLEWYRLGWDDHALADEVIALFAVITGRPPTAERLTWRNAFRLHAHLDPVTASIEDLHRQLGTDAGVVGHDRAAALDLILTRDIEPHLGRGVWTIMTDYPASACAQARIRTDADGLDVAARFEIYGDGIELANGYHELTNAAELKQRHQQELATRSNGEQLDELFHRAMEHGLPNCAGVAVGFDRLVMIALGLPQIADTQAIPWSSA